MKPIDIDVKLKYENEVKRFQAELKKTTGPYPVSLEYTDVLNSFRKGLTRKKNNSIPTISKYRGNFLPIWNTAKTNYSESHKLPTRVLSCFSARTHFLDL